MIRLFSAYFGRKPDPSGLNYWLTKRRSGTKLDAISSSFAASNEFKTKYGTDADAAQQKCRSECRDPGINKIQGSGAGEPYAFNSADAKGSRKMACRIRHVSRVLGDPNPGLCGAVFGGTPCDM